MSLDVVVNKYIFLLGHRYELYRKLCSPTRHARKPLYYQALNSETDFSGGCPSRNVQSRDCYIVFEVQRLISSA